MKGRQNMASYSDSIGTMVDKKLDVYSSKIIQFMPVRIIVPMKNITKHYDEPETRDAHAKHQTGRPRGFSKLTDMVVELN